MKAMKDRLAEAPKKQQNIKRKTLSLFGSINGAGNSEQSRKQKKSLIEEIRERN